MNNSVAGICGRRRTSYQGFPSRSCRRHYSFRMLGCELQVLWFVSSLCCLLMPTTKNKVCRIHADLLTTSFAPPAAKGAPCAAARLCRLPFAHYTRRQMSFSWPIVLGVIKKHLSQARLAAIHGSDLSHNDKTVLMVIVNRGFFLFLNCR